MFKYVIDNWLICIFPCSYVTNIKVIYKVNYFIPNLNRYLANSQQKIDLYWESSDF
ncbi:MAG: hypothetical protein ACI86M_001713 [Saprospiraceae bacterium]|jgi:hypothetical protein